MNGNLTAPAFYILQILKSEKQMSIKCKCPRCGTPLILKGIGKSEAKAKAKLLLAMQAERTYVCPKCGYQHQSHRIIIK